MARKLSELYNISSKGNIRGKAKQGFIRPTIGEFFMSHRDFEEIRLSNSIAIPFDTESNYTLEDGAKIEISGGVGKLSLLSGYTDDLCVDDSKADASSYYGPRIPAHAFDNLNSTYSANPGNVWGPSGAPLPQWLSYDFGPENVKQITKYTLTRSTYDYNRYPRDWDFQGSNDNSNWITIHSISNFSSWGVGEKETWTFFNSNAYRYYRWYITDKNSPDSANYIIIGEAEMMEGTTAFSTTPYYLTTTNNSQIDTSIFNEITGVTVSQTTPANTDIKYLVSFDGRSTWKYWNGSSWQNCILSIEYTDDLCTEPSNASADGNYPGREPSKAFDNVFVCTHSSGNAWHHFEEAFPHYLKYNFGAGNEKQIQKYTITIPTDKSEIGDWEFQGSNDDSSWITLHSETSGAWIQDKREFAFSNSNSYRYYRIYMTSQSNIAIAEVEMMESTGSIQECGMSKSTLESLTSSDWTFIDTLDFAINLSSSDGVDTPEVDEIVINYT